VDDNLTATDIHHLSRSIAVKVYNETKIILTVGIYASNERNPEVKMIKDYVYELVQADKGITQIHGFYVDETKKIITFDLVFDFKYKNPPKKIEELTATLSEKYPEYSFYIIEDKDFSV